MRYPVSEKLEIIRIVEGSHLPVKQTLDMLGIPRTTFCSQFTCPGFVDVLLDAKVQVSMDGKGCWMDNVFIERLWRSLKYECVYIHAFETGTELRQGLGKWISYYNADRPHSKLGGTTPNEAYSKIDVQPDPGLTPDQAGLELKLAA